MIPEPERERERERQWSRKEIDLMIDISLTFARVINLWTRRIHLSQKSAVGCFGVIIST